MNGPVGVSVICPLATLASIRASLPNESFTLIAVLPVPTGLIVNGELPPMRTMPALTGVAVNVRVYPVSLTLNDCGPASFDANLNGPGGETLIFPLATLTAALAEFPNESLTATEVVPMPIAVIVMRCVPLTVAMPDTPEIVAVNGPL